MLRVFSHGNLHWIFCPGCKAPHRFDARWDYDGNAENPTLRMRLKSTHLVNGQAPIYCLARVQRGYIEFDPTSTHELAGHVLKLKDYRKEVLRDGQGR